MSESWLQEEEQKPDQTAPTWLQEDTPDAKGAAAPFVPPSDKREAIQQTVAELQAKQRDTVKSAQAYRLSRQEGLPMEIAYNQAEKLVSKRTNWDAWRKDAPAAAKFWSDPDRYSMLEEADINKMSGFEKAWKQLQIYRTQNTEQLEMADIGARMLSGAATKQDERRLYELRSAQAMRPELTDSNFVYGAGVIDQAVKSTGQSFLRSWDEILAGAGIGAATGAAVGGATGTVTLPGFGTAVGAGGGAVIGGTAGAATGLKVGMMSDAFNQVAGQAYLDAKEMLDENGERIDDDLARGVAIFTGLAGGGLELFSLKMLKDSIPGLDNLLTRKGMQELVVKAQGNSALRASLIALAKASAGEGLQEVGEQVSQVFASMAAGGKYDAQGSEIAQQLSPDQLASTFGWGAVGGAGISVGLQLGTKTAKTAWNFARTRAEAKQKSLVQLGDAIRKTGIAQRSPEAFGEYMQALEEGAQSQVTVAPEALTKMFQDMGLTDDQVQEQFPELKQPLADAAEAGADVNITPETFAKLAQFSEPAVFEEFSKDLRAGPEELTAREAEVEAQGLEEMIAAMPEEEKAKAVEASLVEEMTTQLVEAGTDAGAARKQAKLLVAGQMALAQRAGMTVDQLAQRYKVEVKGAETAGPDAMQQPDVTSTPAFQQWFGDSKVVDAEGKPLVVYHGTARSFSQFSNSVMRRNMDEAGDRAFFFTSSPEKAGAYADPISFMGRSGVGVPGSNIIPAYVSLQNPLIVSLGPTESGETYVDGNQGRFVEDARAQGYDGIIFRRNGPSEMVDEDFVVAFSPNQIKSVFNRGTFDRSSDNILFQTASLRRGTETLKRFGLDPDKRYTTREVATALEARQRQRYGIIERGDYSAAAKRRIADWMVEEVMFEVDLAKANPERSAVGWYSTKYQRAMDAMGEAFPELVGDMDMSLPGVAALRSPHNARSFFTALMAITSDGAKVADNFRFAAQAYASFRQTGVVDANVTFGGERNSSMRINLQNIQTILDLVGPDNFATFLLRKDTVTNLKKMAKEQGKEFTVAYKASMPLPYSALVFGPKLGAFYANLMGDTGYLTMDRWWSRTFNRYRGTLLRTPTDEGIARFKELVTADRRLNAPAESMTDDEAIAMTVDYVASYKAKGYKNGTEIEKAANTIYKAAFEQLEDQPFNASDREFMIDTVMAAQKSLKRKGVDLTVADIQAVLWYYEKRLYGELGARQTQDVSYEEIARRAARSDPAGRSADELARDDAGRGETVLDPNASGQTPGTEGAVDATERLFQTDAALRPDTEAVRRMARGSAPARDGTIDYVAVYGQDRPIYEVTDPEAFRELITAAKADMGAVGAQVFAYDDYSGMRLFVFDGGYAGFALKGDDLVSVFAVPGMADPGAVARLMPVALSQGARRLDAFDTFLPRLYAQHGFVETRREPWSDEFQPEGWDAEAMAEFNDGRPDVVYMEATNEAVARASQQAGDGGGRYSSAGYPALEGAPTVAGASGPDLNLVSVAEQYAREAGIDLRRQAQFVEVDVNRAQRIAQAYEQMPHAPQDPIVREAYENLIRQTTDQYLALERAGYQFYFFDPEGADPYADMPGGFGNPWNAMRDLRANKRMAVFPTSDGFGSSDMDVSDNPLLVDTGIQWPWGSPDGELRNVTANDLFRAVHDAFGHGLEGAGFRARGEENAWQAHARLFTGSAVGALTSETRGQNSWLNFGPYGETNRTASVEETVFADQKTGLMPEWTWAEGRAADEVTRLNQDVQPVFYSAMLRGVESAKQPKAPAAQWMGILKNMPGVKQEELDWLGVEDWLKSQDGSVTKEQLVEYIRANQVNVEEVMRGEAPSRNEDVLAAEARLSEAEARLEALPGLSREKIDAEIKRYYPTASPENMVTPEQIQTMRDLLENSYKADRDKAREDINSAMYNSAARHGHHYRLPGGENYREIVLTMPGQIEPYVPDQMHFTSEGGGTAIGWARIDDRTGPNGERILHVDEIQTKRHQDALKKGYRKRDDGTPAFLIRNTVSGNRGIIFNSREEAEAALNGRYAGLPNLVIEEVVRSKDTSGVPDAPFKTTWDELVLKRVLRYAIDNGYDSITWPSGEIVADRYNMRNQIDNIAYELNDDGYRVLAFKDRQTLVEKEGLDEAGLRELVGEGIASQIIAGEGRKITGSFGMKEIDSADLAIGGDFLLNLYNKRIPRFLSKLTKKMGGEVGTTKLGEEMPTKKKVVWTEGDREASRVFDTREEAENFADAHDIENFSIEDVSERAELPNWSSWRQLLDNMNTRIQGLERGLNNAATEQEADRYRSALSAATRERVNIIAEEPQRYRSDDRVEVWTLPITDEMRAAVPQGLPLFQTGDQPRGFIEFTKARDIFKITLTGNANLSTFLHESGHYFLEVMTDLVESGQGNIKMAEDLQLLKDWAGVGPDGRFGVEQHEKFARAFEAYLMEGSAPSSGLKALFHRFKGWLTFIYKSAQNLNVELTPEVREVMDRMLATDEEIAKARKSVGRSDTPMDQETMGLTDAEYEQYIKLWEAAQEAETARLDARQMNEFKQGQKESFKNEVQRNIDAMQAELEKTKGYQTWIDLRDRETKLQRDTLTPEQRQLAFGLHSSEGVDADSYATAKGYDNGLDMLKDIQATKERQKQIPQIAEEMARKAHGFMDDKSIEDAAQLAIHDKEAQEVALLEYMALTSREGRRARKGFADWINAQARQRVGTLTRRQLEPAKWRRAEVNAAAKSAAALAKGDKVNAALAKRQQIMASAMYRATLEANERFETIRNKLMPFTSTKRRARLGKAGPQFRDAVDEIMESISFKRITGKEAARQSSLREMIQYAQDNQLALNVPDKMPATDYASMTLNDLETVHDVVMNIWKLAKKSETALLDGRRVEFDTIMSEAERTAALMGPLDRPTKNVEGKMDGVKNGIRKFRASLVKPEFIFGWLDGTPAGGVLHKVLFQPFVDAQKASYDLFQKFKLNLIDPMRAMPAEQKNRWAQKMTVFGNKDSNGATIIAAALNLGNELNKQRLMKGLNMTEEQVMAEINRFMTKEDWDMVQLIWDQVDTLWPMVESTAEKATGLKPEKSPALPIQTPYGEYRGGYYPIVYDRRVSKLGDRMEAASDELFGNDFLRNPVLANGFTKGRVEDVPGDNPLLLDMSVLSRHLGEVIHYVTHYEAVDQANRLLRRTRFKNLVKEHLGDEYNKTLQRWLLDIARNQDSPTETKWEAVSDGLRWLRGGTSIATMGYNLFTASKQLLGLTTALDAIPARYVLQGIAKMYLAPMAAQKSSWKFAMEKSKELRPLIKSFDRDVRMVANTYAQKTTGKVIDKIVENAFVPMGYVQATVNVAIWQGAFDQAQAKGMTEAEAVNYADAMVRQTQGSGGIKDLAAVQRSSEGVRLMTMFYSWMSVMYNRLEDMAREQKRMGVRNVPRLARRLTVAFMLTTMIEEAGRRAYEAAMGGEDDEDDPGYALSVLLKTGDLIVGTVPFFRTFFSFESQYRKELTPVSRGIDDIDRTLKALADLALEGEPLSRSEGKAAARGLSVATRKPVYGVYRMFDEWFGEDVFDE